MNLLPPFHQLQTSQLHTTNGFCRQYPNNNNYFNREDLISHARAETTNWQRKHYTSWSQEDLLSWICYVETDNNRDYENVNWEEFSKISPQKFANLSKQDFINLSGSRDDGLILYYAKEKLIKRSVGIASAAAEHEILPTSQVIKKKQRGRPRKHPNATKKNNGSKKCKLWEFLRNLLHNSETCPSLIKWDNYEHGMFKFVQSEKVAKLWGVRNHKENNNMNYEKLSRAMRYYYKDDVLKPVTGKRLVYKFGPNAVGWKTNNPIL